MSVTACADEPPPPFPRRSRPPARRLIGLPVFWAEPVGEGNEPAGCPHRCRAERAVALSARNRGFAPRSLTGSPSTSTPPSSKRHWFLLPARTGKQHQLSLW